MRKCLLTLLLAALLPPNAAYAQMLTIHYNRPSADYQSWKLWVWNESDKKPGFDSFAVDRDTYGLVFRIDTAKLGLTGKKIGLLPRKGNWVDKDSPDRFCEPGAGPEIWLTQADPAVYAKTPSTASAITAAWCDGPNKIRAVFYSPENPASIKKKGLTLRLAGKEVPIKHVHLAGSGHSGRVAYIEPGVQIAQGSAELNGGKWALSFKDSTSPTTVWAGRVLDAYEPNAKFWASASSSGTALSVFAPAAVKVSVLLKNSPQDAQSQRFDMDAKPQGLWTVKLPGDVSGRYYRFRVERNGVIVEGVDPYAKALSADGQWGLFVNDATAISAGPRFDNSENIIYELHLRDVSMDPQSGIKHKGKFLGLAEAGTRHSKLHELTTGLDHLKELGVNTIHLLPVQEFDGGEDRYDWGYMPWHFNAPEGSYATNPEGQTRVAEFKTLVDTLHKNGFKVVMDVVYNHTAETGPSSVYSFNALAKDYYYRTKDDGSYYNGSGCGNEFRSDSP
ncbi:MAG TPA: pullulanase-associated domain-containing protein, partial [Elusimicrobiales bacterium]|nr:pullulanase-associated domain-containing protein [Elusimicrobiales bacterium]